MKKFKRALALKLKRNPFDLAHYFCSGNGLEVGAMSNPYIFGNNCYMSYADIYSVDKLQSIIKTIPIKDLYKGEYVEINHQLMGPRYGFEAFEDGTFDFVYSSNSLEHTPNPIWALIEQLRITKSGGVVYAVIPNKDYTYDCKRVATAIDILTHKYINLIFEYTLDEALDVINNSSNHPLYDQNKQRAVEYATEILARREGIHHFHVFDEINTLQMLLYINQKTGVRLEYFAAPQKQDIQFALRKVSN